MVNKVSTKRGEKIAHGRFGWGRGQFRKCAISLLNVLLDPGAPGWLCRLSIRHLISPKVIMSGSWDWVLHRAWSLLKILSFPLLLQPPQASLTCSLSLFKKKGSLQIIYMEMRIFFTWTILGIPKCGRSYEDTVIKGACEDFEDAYFFEMWVENAVL